MFIGREEELNFLEDRYNSADGQLVVLYGRRRVGKTELLRQFCQDKEHIFYTCTEIIDEKQLEAFSQRVLEKNKQKQKKSRGECAALMFYRNYTMYGARTSSTV